MRVWTIRLSVLAAGVIAMIAAACGRSDSRDVVWASEVDAVVAQVTTTHDAADAYGAATFYSAGGTLDLSHWGLGVSATPDEIVRAVQQLWMFQPGRASVDSDHVFVTPDGALIWWFAHEPDGFTSWMQAYSFAGNRVASKVFSAVDVPYLYPTDEEDWLLGVVERYLRVWDGSVEAADVYASDVELRDEMAGLVLRGLDAVEREVARGELVQPGPWPTVFHYSSGSRTEAIIIVEVADDCPRLEARRLLFVDRRIAYELRSTHVPSARRCGLDPRDGWWTTFQLPEDLSNNVTEVVDAAGRAVELVNAEPVHEEFTRWLLDRFVAGGLRPPGAVRLWFPPSPDCVAQIGLATHADERAGGGPTVVLCYSHDRLRSSTSESGWRTPPIQTGLHEFAHLWMWAHLDPSVETAFVALSGLRNWNDLNAAPSARGIEHAADTIAWGLAGETDARYPKSPSPDCRALAVRFELLTGRAPITTCESGWSP